jgi:phage tail-like protein
MGKRFSGRFFVAAFVGLALLAGARGAQCGAPTPNPGTGTDPLIGNLFALEVPGIMTGYFTEVDGIGSENEIVETRIFDKLGNEIVRKSPGRLKFLDVTLKRGMTSGMDAWAWRKMVEDGKITDARTNASIIMYDQTLTPVAQWDFVNAWPSMITAPGITSAAGAMAVEGLTLVHEGYLRVR